MFVTVRGVANEIVDRMAGWGIVVSDDDAIDIARISDRPYEAIDEEELQYIMWLWLDNVYGREVANDCLGYDAEASREDQIDDLADLVAEGWPDLARTTSRLEAL